MNENWRANCLQQRFAIALKEYTLEMQEKRYSSIHLHEIHHSPLIACGEGVGGGVLVSQLIENRYI
ncbi:hypothetical protein NIES806_40900 [Dolichospermum compactum NIES-806]|uniref:BRCT domain-containing protein n=1 Tax=Dolichospermum compactum NIES-806 TaxID=1973481 RepID=A0A1Z4V8U1_9CYAN|nr:hypothetical protein NIES806_40900 [Dolichospermum compactum NIES-806]